MKKLIVVGVVMLVLGPIIGAGLLVTMVRSTTSRIDSLARVPLSGGPATFAEAGEIEISAEYDHTVAQKEPRPQVTIELIAADGTVVPTAPYSGSNVYNLGGKSGVTIATAVLPSAGTYQVDVSGAVLEGGNGAGGILGVVDLALGPAVLSAGSFVLPLVGGILSIVIGVVFGILFIVVGTVVTLVRKDKPAPT